VIKCLAVLVIVWATTPFHGAVGNGQEGKVHFPVYLNHFYLTLDHATYSDIESNEFMRREFAVTELRTTVRKDRTYTGLYFYGTNTYFEFFDSEKETGRRVGDSAIAFGVDEPGASGKLENALGTRSATITRQLGNVDIPWFYQTMPRGMSLESGISMWVMEYHPRFLAEWHAEAGGSAGITRRAILQRYKEVLKRGAAHTSLSDVVAITMAADKMVTARMIELSKIFGYKVRIEGENSILQGLDFELRLVPATGSTHGIRQVVMRADRMPPGQTQFQFGSSSALRLHSDGTATWGF